MNEFDPDFTYFLKAKRYCAKSTDHDTKFQAFREFVSKKHTTLPLSSKKEPYVIQFVCHPNFEQHRKVVLYYISNKEKGGFDCLDSLPMGFRRGNSYHNYKTDLGHPKGLYYELNLYTQDGKSRHHTSRVKGIHFQRDDSHDLNHGMTKGRHWLENGTGGPFISGQAILKAETCPKNRRLSPTTILYVLSLGVVMCSVFIFRFLGLKKSTE